MVRGIGWSVDQAGLSVVIGPSQVPARVFIRSKDICASELTTGLAEDCPSAKGQTLSMTIETRRSIFKGSLLREGKAIQEPNSIQRNFMRKKRLTRYRRRMEAGLCVRFRRRVSVSEQVERESSSAPGDNPVEHEDSSDALGRWSSQHRIAAAMKWAQPSTRARSRRRRSS